MRYAIYSKSKNANIFKDHKDFSSIKYARIKLREANNHLNDHSLHIRKIHDIEIVENKAFKIENEYLKRINKELLKTVEFYSKKPNTGGVARQCLSGIELTKRHYNVR